MSIKKEKKKKHSTIGGFTLIEMVFVVVILGVIAVIAVPMLRKAIIRTNEASAISTVRTLNQAENALFISEGKYKTLGELSQMHYVDERFGNRDPNVNEASYSGYEFSLKHIPNPGGEANYIISARPTGSNLVPTGTRRFGTDKSGAIYYDTENLSNHFTNPDEFQSATVVSE